MMSCDRKSFSLPLGAQTSVECSLTTGRSEKESECIICCILQDCGTYLVTVSIDTRVRERASTREAALPGGTC